MKSGLCIIMQNSNDDGRNKMNLRNIETKHPHEKYYIIYEINVILFDKIGKKSYTMSCIRKIKRLIPINIISN